MYTVSQLSKISGVSVRALQHYHRIGLLNPTKIGEMVTAITMKIN